MLEALLQLLYALLLLVPLLRSDVVLFPLSVVVDGCLPLEGCVFPLSLFGDFDLLKNLLPFSWMGSLDALPPVVESGGCLGGGGLFTWKAPIVCSLASNLVVWLPGVLVKCGPYLVYFPQIAPRC